MTTPNTPDQIPARPKHDALPPPEFSKKSLWGVFVLGLIIDQLTKYAALDIAKGFENSQTAILPFLDFNLIWNRGVSYGLFAANSPFGQWMLIGITSAICILFVYFLRNEQNKYIRLGFVFVISGAFGNIIDRAIHGAVIDFISFHAYGYYWYVFNVADIWITIGALLVLFANLRALKDERK